MTNMAATDGKSLFKNLLLLNQLTGDIETWCAASNTQALPLSKFFHTLTLG